MTKRKKAFELLTTSLYLSLLHNHTGRHPRFQQSSVYHRPVCTHYQSCFLWSRGEKVTKDEQPESCPTVLGTFQPCCVLWQRSSGTQESKCLAALTRPQGVWGDTKNKKFLFIFFTESTLTLLNTITRLGLSLTNNSLCCFPAGSTSHRSAPQAEARDMAFVSC